MSLLDILNALNNLLDDNNKIPIDKCLDDNGNVNQFGELIVTFALISLSYSVVNLYIDYKKNKRKVKKV